MLESISQHSKQTIRTILVTVIITTRNREVFLRKAIDSVLDQITTFLYEIVIVDNSDKPLEKTYLYEISSSAHKLSYIYNSKPLGSTLSLIQGVSIARTKYVAILDDDDFWQDHNKLSYQVNFLENNPQHSFCSTRAYYINYHGNHIAPYLSIYAGSICRKNLLRCSNPIIHSSVLFRLESYNKVGGYSSVIERGKDLDLWLKLLTVGEGFVLSSPSVTYRSRDNLDRLKAELSDFKYLCCVLAGNASTPKEYSIVTVRLSFEIIRFIAIYTLLIIHRYVKRLSFLL